MSDSLNTLKRRRRFLLLGAAALLAAMVVWNVTRPSPEAQAAADFSQALMARDPGSFSQADREAMERQWRRFSPETRRQVFFKVAHEEVLRFRAETAALTPEQRSERVQKELKQMRERQARLTEAERRQIRERMQEKEAAEMVKAFLEFYSTEFTAKERAELDPLVREWFRMVEGRY